MQLKKRPIRVTKNDQIILKLFDVVSTDKLSLYLNLSQKTIVKRHKELIND